MGSCVQSPILFVVPIVIPAKGDDQKLRPLPVTDLFSHFSTPPVIPAKACALCRGNPGASEEVTFTSYKHTDTQI